MGSTVVRVLQWQGPSVTHTRTAAKLFPDMRQADFIFEDNLHLPITRKLYRCISFYLYWKWQDGSCS